MAPKNNAESGGGKKQKSLMAFFGKATSTPAPTAKQKPIFRTPEQKNMRPTFSGSSSVDSLENTLPNSDTIDVDMDDDHEQVSFQVCLALYILHSDESVSSRRATNEK